MSLFISTCLYCCREPKFCTKAMLGVPVWDTRNGHHANPCRASELRVGGSDRQNQMFVRQPMDNLALRLMNMFSAGEVSQYKKFSTLHLYINVR